MSNENIEAYIQHHVPQHTDIPKLGIAALGYNGNFEIVPKHARTVRVAAILGQLVAYNGNFIDRLPFAEAQLRKITQLFRPENSLVSRQMAMNAPKALLAHMKSGNRCKIA